MKVVKAAVGEEVQLLASTLCVGGSHLSHNPDTLAFDLLGRLLHHYNDYNNNAPSRADDDNNNDSYNTSLDVINDDDTLSVRSETSLTSGSSRHSCSTVASGVSKVIPAAGAAGIKSLLLQCDVKSPRHSALLPILHCFDPPSPLSLFVLEGHSQVSSTAQL